MANGMNELKQTNQLSSQDHMSEELRPPWMQAGRFLAEADRFSIQADGTLTEHSPTQADRPSTQPAPTQFDRITMQFDRTLTQNAPTQKSTPLPQAKVGVRVLAAVLALAVSACASPEEQRERRENAFDLSGGYKASQAAGSQVDMSFEIMNESGRHDIVVNLKRQSSFTEAERQFLAKAGLDANRIFNTFGTDLTLGRGSEDRLEGGENISDDFGETSAFYVCTSEYQYDRETKVAYCLNGKAAKSTHRMEGDLILRWVRTHEKAAPKSTNGQSVTEITQDETRLHFMTDMSRIFYKQYLGAWSGECYVTAAGLDVSACQTMSIQARELDDTVFTSIGQTQRISYAGRNFVLDEAASRMSLETLRGPDFPAVLSVFRSSDGSAQRILVTGQIWSLGELTGSVVMIDGASQKELANFRLKKN